MYVWHETVKIIFMGQVYTTVILGHTIITQINTNLREIITNQKHWQEVEKTQMVNAQQCAGWVWVCTNNSILTFMLKYTSCSITRNIFNGKGKFVTIFSAVQQLFLILNKYPIETNINIVKLRSYTILMEKLSYIGYSYHTTRT